MDGIRAAVGQSLLTSGIQLPPEIDGLVFMIHQWFRQAAETAPFWEQGFPLFL